MSKIVTTSILSPVFIVFFSLSSYATSFSDINNVGEVLVRSKQREFDYLSLALQWPGTYCRRTHKCCQSNGCCRSDGAPQHFTIHGLWPDYNDGTWPACCTNDSFDMNKISTLSKDLYEYWPTLSCGQTSTCHGHKGPFWAHEWEKHGTCAASVLGDEYEYFRTTLTIYFKYNITEALSEAGYVPSNSEKYPLGGVRTAIENAFHLSPLIVCSGDAIGEIRLCFDKNLKPRDCVNTVGIKTEGGLSRSSCPKYVSLPTYDSSGLRNGRTFSQVQPDIQAI